METMKTETMPPAHKMSETEWNKWKSRSFTIPNSPFLSFTVEMKGYKALSRLGVQIPKYVLFWKYNCRRLKDVKQLSWRGVKLVETESNE